ncbi:indigoidine synthase A-like protein [Vararia minispora EC-137]|uniref:Indigoidine synthase A-like protein n=1 Tax=Vararia minispora EC-137 TaxID=1314806 RepID=A0ACB8QM64_9AGAM|nr:indigoidine synthase A-like protein [Vararia minispora EC-137]
MLSRHARCFSITPRVRKAVSGAFPASLLEARNRGAPIDVHPEVEDALSTGRPVVALETTIVTHGMPYPINLSTAQSVETAVRKSGAVPATIGLLGGRAHIGLTASQLERLAELRSGSVKTSRRDIAAVMALKKDGGTTCSATLVIAALAGIKFFATGGLGGVHRGGESSLDISADLPELTRCPVGLVSAGVKSILDIGRTLEYLETLGVPVVSYGSSDFPAFYSRQSGFKSPWFMTMPEQAANLLYNQWALGMQHGALFAVPIPEEYEETGKELQRIVEDAVRESVENGVSKRGKEVTPWLLQRVHELSGSKSLKNNIALIENTALVAGQMAVAYSKLVHEKRRTHLVEPENPSQTSSKPRTESASLVVVGSAAVDITSCALSTPSGEDDGRFSTSPGTVRTSLGGVGRNVAEAAHRTLVAMAPELDRTAVLVSCVGDDLFGRSLVGEMGRIGMRTDGIVVGKGRTAVCNIVLDGKGDLVGGVADMDIIQTFRGKALEQLRRHKPNVVCMDGNLSSGTLLMLAKYCRENEISSMFIEPTSVSKSLVIKQTVHAMLRDPEHAPVTFASPNILELAKLYNGILDDEMAPRRDVLWKAVDRFSLGLEYRNFLQLLAQQNASANGDSTATGTLQFLITDGVAQMAVSLLPVFQHLIVKCGDRGVFLAMRIQGDDIAEWATEQSDPQQRIVVAHGDKEVVVLKHFPPSVIASRNIVNVTGAGDTLVGALLAALARNPAALKNPRTMDQAIMTAQKAAVLTLQSESAVSPLLSTAMY